MKNITLTTGQIRDGFLYEITTFIKDNGTVETKEKKVKNLRLNNQ